MKHLILITAVLLALTSCSGSKHIEKAINHGNYDQAISSALKKLDRNKDKKRKQQYILMLKEAYLKAVDKDLNTIAHLKRDGNPEQYKTIYKLYSDLHKRQEAIKPILPLKVGTKSISLNFNNYTSELVEYRYKTSDYLIDKGLDLLDSDNKYNARQAYSLFKYIDEINPNFEDVRSLMQEAHSKGIDYILVSTKNETHQIIPKPLEEDLLNLDTYKLNSFWTAFHTEKSSDITYDYAIQLHLKQIMISPEHINERQYLRQRDIVDGWEYLLDENGNVAKDSLGNDIKVDRIVNVKARLFEIHKQKSAQVIGNVYFKDLKTNQVINTFPIDSEFVFDHVFARFRGDERALRHQDFNLIEEIEIPFPTDNEMVYDTTQDLKGKFKAIIRRQYAKG